MKRYTVWVVKRIASGDGQESVSLDSAYLTLNDANLAAIRLDVEEQAGKRKRYDPAISFEVESIEVFP